MNPSIEKLYHIAQKPQRLIIGLMSGTSVDGLDVALCKVMGNGADTKTELLHFETAPFDDDFKSEIKSVFSKKEVDLEKLTLLNPWIALRHASIINDCIARWGYTKEDIDLIASHGQTIYHAPMSLHGQKKFGNATLQIGDGDHLAVATGIITISDFRQKHIAAGGEGAPLAVYGDQLIFGKKGEERILLNIGGIANFTSLPADNKPEHIFSTDVGPGNTMMDAYMQQQFPGKYFDEDAAVAKQGTVNDLLLAALKDNVFFDRPFPKTTGPELFNLQYLDAAKAASGTSNISVADTMATLNRFSADMIITALKKRVTTASQVHLYASGGGMHNPSLMEHIKNALPSYRFYTTNELHINPDAKEAVLFAVLANECVTGNAATTGTGLKDFPAVVMGKISLPH